MNRKRVFMVLFGALLSCQATYTRAMPGLSQEQLDNSLRVDFWYGGWEPDYTTTAYELMLSYRGINKMNLLAGYGDAKNIYFNRSKVYAGGYYFYRDYSYFRTSVSQKTYDYPLDPATRAPNPDSTSYSKEPKLELELSHYFSEKLRAALSFDVAKPELFYDPATTVTNYKLGTEIQFTTAIPELRTKLYAAMLRSPDPAKTRIQGRGTPPALASDVEYMTSSLFGAAVGYVKNSWEVELKLLENRDLDASYSHSLFTKYILRLNERQSLRLDYLHDQYSDQSYLAGKSADVYMASYSHQYSPGLKLGVGYKHVEVPGRSDNTGFLYIQGKTGIFAR